MSLPLKMTNHACKIAAQKKFDAETIQDTYAFGEVAPSDERPGQFTVTKNGIVLVGVEKPEYFLAITIKRDHTND